MAGIQGIGGVFIHSEDPERLAAWYRDVMGLELEAHPDGSGFYRVFSTRDPDSSILRANPVFAIHRATESLATRGRGFVINLRIDDLVSFLGVLRDRNVDSEPISEHPYGLFSAVQDPDGNRLELYEERFPE